MSMESRLGAGGRVESRLVDGNVGFTGAHGVEDIWRVSPPYAPLGSAGLVRESGRAEAEKAGGLHCPSITDWGSHHEQRPGIWAEGIDRN